jgi:superfamily II DNA or RNA helicase
MQCGPIRYSIKALPDDAVPRTVFVRRSSFELPAELGHHPPIHSVWEALVSDVGRTKHIVADIKKSLSEGRCPLVLSDRRAHLDKLEAELTALIAPSATAIYRLDSGVGKKRREAIQSEIDHRFEADEKFVLFSTGSLIGEGYDLPRLDTLFLAMPLSFKGRLTQYAGRLHRPHPKKREIRVYDYVDEGNPLTSAMFRRRSSAYKEMGYRIIRDTDTSTGQMNFR